MAEPNRKKPRITEDLVLLGKTLHKQDAPEQHTPKATTAPAKSFVHTPGSAARTPTAASRVVPIRRGRPTTPHAIRALQQRRNAAFTPGRDRRKSGQLQRETPRDDLRKLSKVLAKTTRHPEPSPPVTLPRRHSRSVLQDNDDSPALQNAPRLSMTMKEMDDDSFHEIPPRLSYPLDRDDDWEDGRRAFQNQRASRVSFGEPSFADLNDLGMGIDPDEEDNGLRARDLPDYGRVDYEMDEFQADDETGELRAMLAGRRQSGLNGSSVTGRSPETEGEPTFVFRIPERRRNTLPLLDTAIEDGQDRETIADKDDWSDVGEEHIARQERRESPPAIDVGRRTATANKASKRVRKELKVSRFGIEYPSMPTTVIKRIASAFPRSYGGSGKLSKETVDCLSEASDWFFEQVSEDLSSYAQHAGRRTIEESDVIALMKRQRQINATTTPFSLAQKFLPRELVQEIRMAPPNKLKRKRRSRLETIDEEEDE